jgi:spermidine synthase
MMDCEIRIVGTVPVEDFVALYLEAGWWEEGYTPDFIAPLVAGSTAVAAAFAPDGRMVGMGRALSDGSSDAYIQDVVVRREFRRQGIGAAIIRALIAELRRRGIDWISLVGQPGTRSFYEGLGFVEMKDHLPMRLRDGA